MIDYENRFIGIITLDDDEYWPEFKFIDYDGSEIRQYKFKFDRLHSEVKSFEMFETIVSKEHAVENITSLSLIEYRPLSISENYNGVQRVDVCGIFESYLGVDSKKQPVAKTTMGLCNDIPISILFATGTLSLKETMIYLNSIGMNNKQALQNIKSYLKILRPDVYNTLGAADLLVLNI